jgi:hypothetical protein
MERHPVRDELLARALHRAGLSAGHVRQAALHGAQATLEHFDVPDAATRSRAYGDRKQSMVIELCERLRWRNYNYEAALISQGVIESRRLVEVLGGRAETADGLATTGDM